MKYNGTARDENFGIPMLITGQIDEVIFSALNRTRIPQMDSLLRAPDECRTADNYLMGAPDESRSVDH